MADGKTLSLNLTKASKEYAFFQINCRKCIECRLDYARQWAIRSVHESQMHPRNSFITLTYRDDALVSPRLDYTHWQKFMKKLRKLSNEPIGFLVAGEYGDKTKRPHWHALLFNYQFTDLEYVRSNDRGDRLYKSDTLDRVWSFNCRKDRPNEVGELTFHSAGYCARYAAKKLVHGLDGTHDYDPIFKPSSKHAIGKRWLEKYYEDVFNYGKLKLLQSDGTVIQSSIPRYYERWFKEHHPEEWLRYVTEVKAPACLHAFSVEAREQARQRAVDQRRSERTGMSGVFRGSGTNRLQSRKEISKAKFDQLQSYLKL